MRFFNKIVKEIERLSPKNRERLKRVCQKQNPTSKDLLFLPKKSPLFLGSENPDCDFGGWFEEAIEYFSRLDKS